MQPSDPAEEPTSPLDRAPPLNTAGEGGEVERPGEFIGPYKLLEVLGEGGFGVVYLAERRSPMVQRVALKVIKPGMDTRSVLARFEQERQALAVMDHPNVAKVLDGGVSFTGRPYFVMELVRGEPITAFADRARLTLSQRLELFLAVCDAVQHAHMKGIIHRDIKPSNILVAPTGDGGSGDSPAVRGMLVKVIDFGIAKAISHTLTEKTIFTERGQLIGTPAYMSPEQADPGATDVDTRTDVYSLGVVLYELLSGTLPFDARSLRAAGYAEIQRIIREEDPPRPSTKLGAADDKTGAEIAKARQTDRERISGELRRELEWIPLKALRKDRTRRYASAESLAADVRRYLQGKPLEAAPESRVYLLRKFVRRNRVQVTAAGAVAAALVAGFGTALWQAREAAKEARRADERATAAELAEKAAETARDAEKERAEQLKKVSDFQSQMLSQIDTTQAGIDLMADVRERFVAALETAGIAETDRTARLDALRQELVRVNATDAAAAMIDRTILKPAIKTIDTQFKDDPATDARLRQALAELYLSIGLYDAAYPLQESALATRRRVLGEEHPETLVSIHNMGGLLFDQGRLAEAETLFREALDKRRRVLGAGHEKTISTLASTALLLEALGKAGEAEAIGREALQARRRELGETHPETIESINNMGLLLEAQGKLAEAEPYYREALQKSREVNGEEHRETITILNNVGLLLQSQGKYDESEPYLSEALEKCRRVCGDEHPETLGSINNMGFILQYQGRFDAAAPFFQEALEKRRRVLGDDHPDTLNSISNLGRLLRAQGKLDEAELHYRDALEKGRRVFGDDHPSTLRYVNNMGALLQTRGRLAEAEPYYRESLERRRRVLGEEHPETLISLDNVGSVLQDQGKLDEAEVHLQEALGKFRRVLGDEHPDTLLCVSLNLRLHLAQRKHQEALSLAEPFELATRKAFSGGNAPRLASFLTLLGRARVRLGHDPERFAAAESNLLEAHAMYLAAKDRGPMHKDTLGCVQTLIDLYTAWEEAEPGKGHAAKAAEWKSTLDAAKPPAPAAPGA